MTSMVICHYPAVIGRQGSVLLVMLPGVAVDATAFAARGLVEAVQRLGQPVDVVAARPDLDLYLDGDVATALHRTIIEPALAQGYSRVWLLGISLGGMGALLYASRYATHVEGVVLLAPFLGTQGTVAEVVEAGGLIEWSAAGSSATAGEQRMLAWLQRFLAQRAAKPALYLGYGRADRFARGHRLLTEHLPAHVVVSAEGGHDWETWLTLWHRVLDLGVFADPDVE